MQKRKALGDELDELKKKKARIHQDITALEKSADEYADKAENTGNLTYNKVKQSAPHSQGKESLITGPRRTNRL